jgi:hypothetical protein
MKRLSPPLLLVWCLYPLSVLLLHFTLGERWRAAEGALSLRTRAIGFEQEGRLQKAASCYKSAQEAALVDDLLLRTRLNIDEARVAILQGEAFEGVERMEQLLSNHPGKSLPRSLKAEANATCALGLYYAAYALRLDNNEPDLWQQEAAEARAIFLRLHEQARRSNLPEEAALYGRNLEAAIRLQRGKLAEIAVNPPPPASLAARDRSVFHKKMQRLEKRAP